MNKITIKTISGFTAEELAEIQAKIEEEKTYILPTDAERLEALETAFMELVEVVVNG